jgi:hypothetical protein
LMKHQFLLIGCKVHDLLMGFLKRHVEGWISLLHWFSLSLISDSVCFNAKELPFTPNSFNFF